MSQFSTKTDLLHTKLHPPPVREKRVDRTRLLERLDASTKHKLSLVCAPAGYGKTTLLSQWIEHRSKPVGWFTIDSSDNDAIQFLRYLLAALQRIDPNVGALIPGMLQPPRPLSSPAILTALINDLAASQREFILLLDDYQHIEERAVHDLLERIIEHMPTNLHLIISARADPPLNLAQLRARGQLLELRAVDLCFSAAEAKSFFQEVMGLQLQEKDATALVKKAEGWAAGLQIAAIMLQNQSNLTNAVQAFTGSQRHILDYLAVEVIECLPETIQDFLRQTAILNDLEPSLCDSVTGRSDSHQILEQLDRENQFIVALDKERRWYRYHRLMAEALQRRTESMSSAQLADLHQRASAWYQGQGRIEAAIEHAFKAGDSARAAELIEEGAEETLKRSQIVTLLRWLERLPEEALRSRPGLNIIHAWALLLKGGAVQAVREKLGASSTLSEISCMSPEEAVIQGLIATLTGDVDQGLSYSRHALDDLPSDRIFLRSIAADNLGMAYVLQGKIDSAIQAFQHSSALAREAGSIMFAVASLSNLGGLYLLKGHLRFAEAVYLQALELATTPYGQRLPVACRAMLGLSEIRRERNELEHARRLLEEAIQLSQQYNETGELMLYLTLARVLQAQGQEEEALGILQKAERIAIQSTATTLDDRLVEVTLARLWLQQGSLMGLREWAGRRGFEKTQYSQAIPGEDTSSIPYDLYEAEWLTYARLLLAEDRLEAALSTLEALQSEAQRRSRFRRLLEIHVLTALAYDAAGSTDQALQFLERSLEQAEPEGYSRVYLDEGFAMVKLLQEAARRGIRKPYCTGLMNAFQEEKRTFAPAPQEGQAGLVEPLSERELEVLHLLAKGCTNREICERLYLSLSTVKGHISNINGKLLARNRTEAVARARQLGILPGG